MMSQKDATWQNYEEVANYLLNQFAEEFGIIRVESKQILKGQISDTEWEIDAKGIGSTEDIFLIIECRRCTTSRQSQEKIAALAYRIHDTGATGGIIVSPLGLQEGAMKIAKAENIHSVILNSECTTTDYILEFLNRVKIGINDGVVLRESLTIVKKDKDGNVVEKRTYGSV